MNPTSGPPVPASPEPPRRSTDDSVSPPSHPGRVAARLARVVENALAGVELSLPQYRMLVFLDESGAAAASALAGRLGVSRPSVTALVDGLVARGWVTRAADPADRRRVSHQVTQTGREVLARADAAVESRLAELAAVIPTADDRAAAYDGLGHWLAAMDTEREARLSQQ